LDLPEVVQLLIDLGAETTQRGCLLDKERTWVCGQPLRLAQKINAAKEVISILEPYCLEKKTESPIRYNTTTVFIGKSNWGEFIKQGNNYIDNTDENLYSASRLLRTIDELTSDPDYLTDQQVTFFNER
jgi:hypothetical protein